MEQVDDIRVLIAEDDYLVGEMIKGLVEEIGYTVVGEAANGAEAVSMTQSLRPDIILMDVEMPDMDGIEASRQINEQFPTPIVILTAYEATDLFRQAKDVGVLNYLVKPSNVRELERAIDLALDQFEELAHLRQQTAELRDRMDAVLRSATSGIFVTDVEGGILEVNPMGQRWLDQMLSPAEADILLRNVCDIARRAAAEPTEMLVLKGLDLKLRSTPVSEHNVENAAVIVSAQIVVAAEEKEELRSKILGILSHEFGTPIATIKLYTELMQRYPERMEEYLSLLMDEVDHQAELLKYVLQLFRIGDGDLDINLMPVSLCQLVDSVSLRFHDMAQAQDVTLTRLPAVADPVVLVDSEQLRHALSQLLRNAIQYTPAGGAVTLSIRKTLTEGQMWGLVAVADTGIGISEEEMPYLFQSFFRGDSVRERQISGLGLGLTIVKEVMELQGGRVMVESQVGEGSTFTLWVPLAEADQGISGAPVD